MKYSEKYPELGDLEVSVDSIMRTVGRSYPCEVCGEPTEYAEINYEAQFCSEECLASFEAEMDEIFMGL